MSADAARSARTLDLLTAADATWWGDALSDVLNTVRHWLSGPVWEPAPSSQADAEIGATEQRARADGTAWTDSPLRTAFVIAGLMCHAALDHAEAATVLIHPYPRSALPLDALARGALTAAAQAWWLLDPSIDGTARVTRCYLMRYADAVELARVAQKLGVSGPVSDFGPTNQTVIADYADLGLATVTGKGINRDPYVCGSERLPTASGFLAIFMEQILDDATNPFGPYAYFSGAAHVQIWRLMQSQAAISTATGPVIEPVIEREPVRSAVRALIDACIQPAMRAAELFGWHHLHDECDQLVNRTNAAFDNPGAQQPADTPR